MKINFYACEKYFSRARKLKMTRVKFYFDARQMIKTTAGNYKFITMNFKKDAVERF